MAIIGTIIVGVLVYLATTADARFGLEGISITTVNTVGVPIAIIISITDETTASTLECLGGVGGTLIGTVTNTIAIGIDSVIELAGSTSAAFITYTNLVTLVIGGTGTTVATVCVSQTSILGGDINGRGDIQGLGKSDKPPTKSAQLLQDAPAKKVDVHGSVNGKVTRKHQLAGIIGKVLDIKVTQCSVSNLSPVHRITRGNGSRGLGRGLGALVRVREGQVAVVVGDVDIQKEKGIARHQVKTGSIAAGSNKCGIEGFFQITRFGRALSQCTSK